MGNGIDVDFTLSMSFRHRFDIVSDGLLTGIPERIMNIFVVIQVALYSKVVCKSMSLRDWTSNQHRFIVHFFPISDWDVKTSSVFPSSQ